MINIDIDSPFHKGERDIQLRLGVRAQSEGLGQRFIRDHLPQQQQAFRVMSEDMDCSGKLAASF